MSEVTYLTKEGLKKLREELDYLMNVERPSISKQIGEAIEKGIQGWYRAIKALEHWTEK